MLRAGGNFVCITFDASGQIVERSLSYGRFMDVARDLEDAARGDVRGYELGGAVIASPSLFPAELSDIVRDALLLRLSPQMGKYLQPHERAAWCRS